MNQFVTFLFVLLMTLGVARAQVKLDPDFVKFKSAGDACFQKKDYACARKNYQSALIIKENDTYCQRQLAAIQNAEKRQQQARTSPSPKVESSGPMAVAQSPKVEPSKPMATAQPPKVEPSKPIVTEPQTLTTSQARPVSGYRRVWDRTFGGNESEYLKSMLATNDGGYLLGGNSKSNVSGDKSESSKGYDDYWIVKIDASGAKLWERAFGGNKDDKLSSMVATRDGGYLLGGYSESDARGDKTGGNKGKRDYWVVKLNASGDKQWDRTFGGKNYEDLTCMLATRDGGYLLAGSSLSDASEDKSENTKGGYDYWVVKIDASGARQWDRTFGGNKNDNLSSMLATRDGGYLLAGSSDSDARGDKTGGNKGGQDYWVVKLDASGAKQWDRTFGGNKDDYLNSMLTTSDGGYLLGGGAYSDTSGDKTGGNKGYDDYWVVKLDASGARQWDQTFGGNSFDNISNMLETHDGGYLLGGFSLSDASGDKSEKSKGSVDCWVVKIGTSGAKQWEQTFGGNNDDRLGSILATRDGGYLLAGSSDSDASEDKSENSKGDQDYWVIKVK